MNAISSNCGIHFNFFKGSGAVIFLMDDRCPDRGFVNCKDPTDPFSVDLWNAFQSYLVTLVRSDTDNFNNAAAKTQTQTRKPYQLTKNLTICFKNATNTIKIVLIFFEF